MRPVVVHQGGGAGLSADSTISIRAASEILALNIDDLDLDNRRAPIRSKGGDTD